MTSAAIDSNNDATMIGRLNSDGTTIQRVYSASISSQNTIIVDDGVTGSDKGGTFAATDDNDRPTIFAEANDGSGNLVALYVNSSGALLVDSV